MPDIEHLNVDCTCITLDQAALCAALTQMVGDPAFCAALARSHPHLIASQPVFLTAAHAEAMQRTISAIERVASLPAYAHAIADHVPDIARAAPGAIGVFMGYDFHLSPDGPKLIEINTNAGGGLINAYLLGAQHVCCGDVAVALAGAHDVDVILKSYVDSFRVEWQRQGRTGDLQRIAIIDDAPQEQYLYPEFVLFKRLFESHGIAALIAAPDELRLEGGHLWHGPDKIDLVYNRVTDFDLSDPRHAVLRSAYTTDAAVVTPNPWAYAQLADKRNLVLLSDPARLAEIGAATDDVETLGRAIPRTVALTRDNADALWKRRNTLFFKPTTGFGSKATYRGDKLTTKAWGGILERAYVAQDIVAPSARAVSLNGQVQNLKADLRCYTYAGRIQLIAARLYSGQTTNFRSEGGGFAPVFVSSANADCRC
jgi:hypothetical protein